MAGYSPDSPHILKKENKHNFIVEYLVKKGKAGPLQTRRDPGGSRKLRFPDFVTTAQDGVRLSALRTGRLYPQEILLEYLVRYAKFEAMHYSRYKNTYS